MTQLRPRRRPRQQRSRATVEAILEACARILQESGPAGLTTNRIAERAGIGIGSLYAFFPNREAILLALAEQRLTQLGLGLERELATARQLGGMIGTHHLIGWLLAEIRRDRELYRLLFREASLLRDLPEVQTSIARFFELARISARRAGANLDLPAFDADVWLIGRMLGNVMLDIAVEEATAGPQELLLEELARLTYRMLGLPPDPPAMA